MIPESYRNSKAANVSSLKRLGISPAHYVEYLERPPADKPEWVMGRATHCLTLEPQHFDQRYTVIEEKPSKAGGPEWDAFEAGRAVPLPPTIKSRRGKAWEAFKAEQDEAGRVVLIRSEWDKCQAWAGYLALVGDREILTAAQERDARAMAEAVRNDAAAMRYLSAPWAQTGVETPIEWVDASTGILCKGIPDMTYPGTLVDLKTARDIDSRAMGRQAASLEYAAQLAFYHDGLIALGHEVEHVAMICVEKSRPHDVGVFTLDADDLAAGRDSYRGWLRTLAACRKSGKWPGRYNGLEQPLALPSWYLDPDDSLQF